MKSKIIIIIFLFLYIKNISTVPYFISHLSDKNKNVFLISDLHDEENEYLGVGLFNKKPYIRVTNVCGHKNKYDVNPAQIKKLLTQKGASIFDDKYIILDSEKEFLNNLLKVDQDYKQEIDIIWEITEQNIYEEVPSCFMEWAPFFLSKNFKRLKVTSANNFRRTKIECSKTYFPSICDIVDETIQIMYSPLWLLNKSKQIWIRDFKKLILALEKLIFETMMDKARNLDQGTQNFIFKDLIEFYSNYLKQYKNLDNKQSLELFEKQIQNKKFKKDFIKNLIEGIADIEMLIPIINSKNKTIVLYAGGKHCETIKNFLAKYMNFKVISEEGDRKIEREISTLQNNVLDKRFCFLIICALLKFFQKLGKLFCYRMMYAYSKDMNYLTYNDSIFKDIKPLDPRAYNMINSNL